MVLLARARAPRHSPCPRPLRAVGRLCPKGRGCWHPCWAPLPFLGPNPSLLHKGEGTSHTTQAPPPPYNLGSPQMGKTGPGQRQQLPGPHRAQFYSTVNIGEGGGLSLQLGEKEPHPCVGRRDSGSWEVSVPGWVPSLLWVITCPGQAGWMGTGGGLLPTVCLGQSGVRLQAGGPRFPCVCRPGCTSHLSGGRVAQSGGQTWSSPALRFQLSPAGFGPGQRTCPVTGQLATTRLAGPVGSATD